MFLLSCFFLYFESLKSFLFFVIFIFIFSLIFCVFYPLILQKTRLSSGNGYFTAVRFIKEVVLFGLKIGSEKRQKSENGKGRSK